MTTIREPAVAGLFYPGDPDALSSTVKDCLGRATIEEGPAPKALIVPHAGYVYSGDVAASAYARLAPHRERYRRVVLLGPCHQVAVRGLASSRADAFRTPLGDVAVDHAALDALPAGAVRPVEATHAHEHSLEVHLPFLQTVLGSFTIVPLVVGDAAPAAVADVIDRLWGGDETLIVISSDLSHYLSYERARLSDRDTCAAIERLDADAIDHAHACGATPIRGMLLSARRHGLQVVTLDLRNSGDTAGPRNQVVGYGAWMLPAGAAA